MRRELVKRIGALRADGPVGQLPKRELPRQMVAGQFESRRAVDG